MVAFGQLMRISEGFSMSRTTLYRTSLVLTLAAVLSLVPQSSWAGAAHHSSSQPPAAPARPPVSLVTQAWNHLVSVWARVGCIIDPNGISAPTGNGMTVGSTNPLTGL
jgi:hypothetical protein